MALEAIDGTQGDLDDGLLARVGEIARVAGLVDRNEYKRRQAPPGVRITERAFGRDRRYPITSGYQNFQNEDPFRASS